MTETPTASPSRKNKTWCFCAGCLLLPILTAGCLIGAYFAGPPLLELLGIIGPKAEEVYGLAPDLEASQSLAEVFEEQAIPGVRVYVIPFKDHPGKGAFLILDVSAGYRGMNPLEDSGDDFRLVLQEITRRHRQQNLGLEHVTIEYRDEAGLSAFSYTVPMTQVELYADGVISQEEFFAGMEIDLLNTIEYLNLEDYLEEIQP